MKNTAMEIRELEMKELEQVNGGDGLNVAAYSEEELARIFDLYLEMYGHAGAIPYLEAWGVTTGDIYLMTHPKYWMDTPYSQASNGWRLAHLIWKRNH